MQQLLPTWIENVDPLEVYSNDSRPKPNGRPWVMVNMIASLDGASAINGLSGDLGGPADRAVFHALRACCDWILVASATANAERYRPASSHEAATATSSHEAATAARLAKGQSAAARLATGQSAAPRLAIVTASGAIDPSIPAFASDVSGTDRPLVITGELADPDRLAALNTEVVRLPTARPEPHAVLAELHERDAAVLLCEGGPTWNGKMVAAELVDELCLSISPILAGGNSTRIVAGSDQAKPAQMSLNRLLCQDDLLFARYTHQRHTQQ